MAEGLDRWTRIRIRWVLIWCAAFGACCVRKEGRMASRWAFVSLHTVTGGNSRRWKGLESPRRLSEVAHRLCNSREGG